jgi:hypothetical protein
MNLESLRPLIHALLEGEITPTELDTLQQAMRENWQVRKLYLELADQQSYLIQQPALHTGRLQAPTPRVLSSKHWWRWAAGFAAAAALVTIFWPRQLQSVRPENTVEGVATLTQTFEAEFDKNSKLRIGDTLKPGVVYLHQGLAQLEFFSGASALIEGQTVIEIISAWEARCHQGRVRVQVPPAAKGFRLHGPDVELEDLGTEFALNVQNKTSAVHVYEGEVIAHTPGQASQSLKQGMSLGNSQLSFLPINELHSLVKQQQEQRFKSWESWSAEHQRDSRLIAYYPFKKKVNNNGWDRLISNYTDSLGKKRAGGAVGAEWTTGRWPSKDALEFKRPGDRVRLVIDGSYQALTFSCWVKINAIDKKYNSLLLTDGYEEGEPHWQIHEDGSLMFSIAYNHDRHAAGGTQKNQTYFSKPVFTSDTLGRWHHIAVTYDSHTGEVTQYFDGSVVGREISNWHQSDRSISYGACEIGNWGLPNTAKNFPVRNLNGAIDEFSLYDEVLSTSEIHQIFTIGRPE